MVAIMYAELKTVIKSIHLINAINETYLVKVISFIEILELLNLDFSLKPLANTISLYVIAFIANLSRTKAAVQENK